MRRLPSAIDRLALPGLAPPHELLDYMRTFDSIVSWYGANQPEFRARIDELRLPFQFFPALPAGNRRTHIVDFFLEHAGAPPGAAPRIPLAPVDVAAAAVAPERRAIVVHPFSGSARKNWPMSKFRALAERLPGPLEWCAAPHEQLPGARKIENLYDLGCWLAGARAFVGNDAGIAHLAAAVGAPVVAIFGPTDPVVWAPRGPRVRIVSGDLENIAVDDVAAAVQSVLR